MTKAISQQKNNPVGEASVDGLLAGLGAGLAMGAYLVIIGLFSGIGAAETLGTFSPAGLVSPITGLLSHLATSAIYGAVFGIAALALRGRAPQWGTGLIYGGVLFLLGWFVILPGTESPLLGLPPLHFFISHLIFGLVLGRTIHKK